MVSRRLAKINRILREELSQILLFEVRDPRISGVTITDVVTSGDTRHAKVFFSVLGDDNSARDALEGLVAAEPFVRKMLSQRVRFRFTPELDFRYDDTAERAVRIIQAIDHAREEDDRLSSESEEE